MQPKRVLPLAFPQTMETGAARNTPEERQTAELCGSVEYELDRCEQDFKGRRRWSLMT